MSQIDIRRLDFGLLLIFAELLRHRKTTVVAERLGLTQSAVSHALRRLRDLFGDPLFLRRPAGLEPTDRALRLEAEVGALIAAAGRLVGPDRPFDPATAEGAVRIGGSDTTLALIAPALSARMRVRAPGLVASFRPLVRRPALDALAAGDLDLAVGYVRGGSPGIRQETLYEEGYAVVARAGHPLLAGGAPSLDAYAAAEHALLSYDGDVRGIVDETMERQGLARRVVVTMPSVFPVLALVAASDVVATVPRRLALAHAAGFGLAVATPPLPIRPFPVSMAWAERSDASPMRRWLAAEVRACVAPAPLVSAARTA
jgi:DNA-binding transcriptional LysR family regulator